MVTDDSLQFVASNNFRCERQSEIRDHRVKKNTEHHQHQTKEKIDRCAFADRMFRRAHVVALRAGTNNADYACG